MTINSHLFVDADDNVEDVFIGIDEVVINVTSEQTEYRGGLYVLGTVPADGEIQMVSFCGILNNSTLNEINITGNLIGRVRLFVFRGEQFINSSVLSGKQTNGAIYCGESSAVRAVKASDEILIYIESTCSLTNDGNNTLCPLQVNIDRQQNFTTEFYNGSDSISNQTIRSFVKESVTRVNASMELNVRVKIRGMCDYNYCL